MKRLVVVLLVGLISFSGLGIGYPSVIEANGDTAWDIKHAVETARLPYEPMVVATEDRRPYLPLLVPPGWELPSFDELKQSGIRFQTDLESFRSTWPKTIRLVTVEEALREAQIASDRASEIDRHSSRPAVGQ
mgnify:CR=1 FL=1